MGQALYRKYRSRSFDEVVGQEHVTKTLKNALKGGKISHAYLFTGPHGVGKTSVARILAHEVNNLPYEDESIHLDIIEIDAASNRRIDEIRELRERVHIAPTSAKYKVYIIDEVHMLTREAFNALLKTLEEPPAHCIFILATTEAHKVPETIVSRTQRFNFKPIDRPHSAGHLAEIAKREKIEITPNALELLADFGGGSFRDSISLLDQLGGSGKIDRQRVLQFLGLPPDEAVDELLQAVSEGRTEAVMTDLDGLRTHGTDAAALAKQIAKRLRADLLSGKSHVWSAALLKEMLVVPATANPEDYLEVSLLEVTTSVTPLPKKLPQAAAEAPAPEPIKQPEPPEELLSQTKLVKSGEFSLADWPNILAAAKKQSGPLYSTLRLASPSLDGNTLQLSFKFPLHHKKMSQAENIDLLGKLIENITGQKLRIRAEVDDSSQPELPASDQPSSIESISNIFGNAEVLES